MNYFINIGKIKAMALIVSINWKNETIISVKETLSQRVKSLSTLLEQVDIDIVNLVNTAQ